MYENLSPKPADPWLKTKDVAAILGVSRELVKQLRDAGKLPYTRPTPRVYNFRRSDVMKYLADTTHHATA